MKRSLLAVLCYAASVLFLAPAFLGPAALATEMEPRANYIVFKPSLFLPESDFHDSNDSGRGIAIEAAYGRRLASFAALEAGLGYIWINGDDDFTIIPMTLTVKGMIPTGQIDPYILGGVGMTYVEQKTTFFGGETDSDWTPQFHLGLGVNLNVAPRFFMGLEGKYVFLKASTFGEDRRLDGVVLSLDFGFRF